MARRPGAGSIAATNALTKRLDTNCDRCKPQSHEDTMRYLKTSPLSLARAQPYQHNAPPGGGRVAPGAFANGGARSKIERVLAQAKEPAAETRPKCGRNVVPLRGARLRMLAMPRRTQSLRLPQLAPIHNPKCPAANSKCSAANPKLSITDQKCPAAIQKCSATNSHWRTHGRSSLNRGGVPPQPICWLNHFGRGHSGCRNSRQSCNGNRFGGFPLAEYRQNRRIPC